MAKLQIEAFKQMLIQGKEYTKKALENSTFVSNGKARAAALARGVADLSTGLVVDHVSSPNFNIHEVHDDRNEVVEDLSLDEDPSKEKNVVVVVNWLVTFVKNIMKKVNDHAGMIRFNKEINETKAEKNDLDQLMQKHNALEPECEAKIVERKNFYGQTDRQTNRPTDKPKYRSSLTELKNNFNL